MFMFLFTFHICLYVPGKCRYILVTNKNISMSTHVRCTYTYCRFLFLYSHRINYACTKCIFLLAYRKVQMNVNIPELSELTIYLRATNSQKIATYACLFILNSRTKFKLQHWMVTPFQRGLPLHDIFPGLFIFIICTEVHRSLHLLLFPQSKPCILQSYLLYLAYSSSANVPISKSYPPSVCL